MCVWCWQWLCGQQYVVVGLFEGVFQQVVEQFLQVIWFVVEVCGWVDIEFVQYVFGGIDFFQVMYDFFGVGFDWQWCGEQFVVG